jgi:hypothetical protein
MSDNDTVNLRLASLEEWRKEQIACTKEFRDGLHRIEMMLQSSSDKACPRPGHCLVLESDLKVKWAGDKMRFEALERNYAELKTHVDQLRATVTRGINALGLLVALATFFGPSLIEAVKHFLSR